MDIKTMYQSHRSPYEFIVELEDGTKIDVSMRRFQLLKAYWFKLEKSIMYSSDKYIVFQFVPNLTMEVMRGLNQC